MSGALGAVAGIIVAPIALTLYDSGLSLGIKGFVACIVGGFGSPVGAALGGLVLGVVEAFAAGYISSGYKNAIAFVLLSRPVPEAGRAARRVRAGKGVTAMRVLLLALAVAAALLMRSAYVTNLMIVIGLQMLPALGLALIAGYTGQISLGHAAFYGLGAYAAALPACISGSRRSSPSPRRRSPFAALAWGIGWLVFPSQGHHLAYGDPGLRDHRPGRPRRDARLSGGPNGLSGIRRCRCSDSP